MTAGPNATGVSVLDTVTRLLAIAAGGATGAVARYAVGVACESVLGPRFGWGTLLVNTAGCFALGLLAHEAWSHPERLGPHLQAGVTVGLLGALTTFSTFGHQTLRHIEAGEPGLALANVALNVALGLLAAAAGLAAGRSWMG